MQTENFSFKPLQKTDLNQLCRWFSKSHVKEWWNDNLTDDEITAKYQERIANLIVHPFMVYSQETPIGFIQYYNANKIDEDWCSGEPAGTVGIDQFIGEEDYLNRGNGTEMIKQFVAMLFTDSVIRKIITDVNKNNSRAIRCYEKAGFSLAKEIFTPAGQVYIMQLKRIALVS